ncbi:MAG: hypothetical protein EB141_08655 [Verrucomicrobia bacterium]|nr:hypothetical protein [Verrucomicrobiota bacterium]NDD40004.1 hypothetical protein [Verrucomicrobiota bacterium]
MFALAAAQLGLMLLMVLLVPKEADLFHWWNYFAHPNWYPDFHYWINVFLYQSKGIICAPILGFSTGPLLTLIVRSTIGGLAFSFLLPGAFVLVAAPLFPAPAFDYFEYPLAIINVVFVGGIYSGASFLLGCRRFQNLEDIHGHGPELSLPAALTRSFAGFTEWLTLNHGGALGQLVRKEVRLHLPAFVVAGMLVGLWLLLLVVVVLRPDVSKAFLMLPSILLGLGIPVIAGIVSTAEERSLGLLDWHLTLPVSARRQWFIKVLVALGVNGVLGLMLPDLMGHAATRIFNDPRLLDVIPNLSNPLLISNAVIFCAALYASTAAANSMRALVGTIVLFLAGAMVLNFADFVVHSFSRSGAIGPAHQRPSDASELVVWLYRTRWPLVWGGLAVWLFILGLRSFRRSLESIWQPVRRMAVFFAVVCAFVFVAIVW